MSNYRKHIDDFFKQKLGNYRETPPPEAWEELETRLDGLTPVPYSFPYRWLWHIAIVSVIVFLGVSVGRQFISKPPEDDQNKPISSNTLAAAIPASSDKGAKTDAQNLLPSTATNPATATNNGTTTNNVKENAGKNEPVAANNQNNENKGSKQYQAAAANKKNNAKNSAKKQYNGNKNTPVTTNTTRTSNTQATANNYRSSLSKPAPEEDTNDNNQATNASPNTTLSVVNKPEVPTGAAKKEGAKPQTGVASKSNSSAKNKPIFPRLEAGVKMGYEGGFNGGDANKFVISPYLQYNLSPKLSLMAQPGIKAAMVPEKQISSDTYYSINEDGAVTQDGPTVIKRSVSGTTIDSQFTTKYTYSQSHDSIVKSNKIGGTTAQFELPILLKYKLSKTFSVYGGINLEYSRYTSISEQTYTAKGMVRSYDTTVTAATAPQGNPAGLGFNYTGNDISTYKGPLTAAQSGSRFSVGYMVGITYAYHKKWLFDALIEQNPAQADYKGGYNINTPLSATYFRLSIGYKLTK